MGPIWSHLSSLCNAKKRQNGTLKNDFDLITCSLCFKSLINLKNRHGACLFFFVLAMYKSIKLAYTKGNYIYICGGKINEKVKEGKEKRGKE